LTPNPSINRPSRGKPQDAGYLQRQPAHWERTLSWDIFVQDLPRDAESIADIPADFRPKPIGNRADVVRQIKEVVPGADFSDPSWGRIEADDWSVEVNMGTNEECNGFALHVRGGDAVVGVIAAVLDHLNLRALSQTGEFFVAGPEALESFQKWRAYRVQVENKSAG
jgi:hypothetical protein